jgi:hypothetical protein
MKYKSKRAAKKAAKRIGLKGIHSHGRGKNKTYMAGSTHAAYERAMRGRKKRSGRRK